MNALVWIVVWGLVSVVAAIVAGTMAAAKNRNASVWIAWCFVLPPLVVLLWLLPALAAPARKRRSVDGEDGDDDLEGLDVDRPD